MASGSWSTPCPEGAGSPPLNLLLNWTALAEKK